MAKIEKKNVQSDMGLVQRCRVIFKRDTLRTKTFWIVIGTAVAIVILITIVAVVVTQTVPAQETPSMSTTDVTRDARITGAPGCSKEYRAIPDHSLCLPNSAQFKHAGIDKATQNLIVSLHNDHRRNPLPSRGMVGRNMLEVRWDDRIAAVAQQYSQSCSMNHDSYSQRQVIGLSDGVGQNLAWGYPSWTDAITGWFDEYKLFIYGYNSIEFGKIGHYTQMVNENLYLIGCGYALCDDNMYRHYYVCNYAPGQMSGQISTPFVSGEKCAGCPRSCRDGLCACSKISQCP